MKNVLACGEGPGDVGIKDWNSKTGQHVYLEGWMQPVIRLAAKEELKITARQLKEIFLSKRPASLKPIPKGHSDKAAMAKLIAGIQGYDAVVFMVDADTNDEPERQRKVSEIQAGFALIDNNVKGVACVPRSTSESWLLSDEKAWKTLGLPDKSSFPKSCPEDLWGVRDQPKDNHPHHVFTRVAHDSGQVDNRDTRNRVSELSSIEVMKQRCPASFKPFADDINNL